MHIIVLITTKDKEEADKISNGLLTKKLIACANIIENVDSNFWWEGKLDKANESLLILKTTKSNFKSIVDVVNTIHSYETPEIIALPILDGNPDYLKWITNSVQKKD